MIGHGSARNTNDLDICYSTNPANLEALGSALVELGATLRGVIDDLPFVPDLSTLKRTSILTLTSQDGDIDLLVGPAGSPPYDELRAHAERVTIDGMGLLIASLDDLETMKRAANRPKDRLDLEEIEVIRRLRARGIGPPPTNNSPPQNAGDTSLRGHGPLNTETTRAAPSRGGRR